jgi:GTP-binding protein EngB required for normal cell division
MKQLSIIGLSNAGKTCYIYAMAKTMIKGYNGLNAIAIDDDLRDKLSMGWRLIRREMKWPEGTANDKVTECHFDCSLNLRPIMDFYWKDFRGGSLTSMNEIDTKFRKEFNDYLQSSDGLLLFVPADTIQDILHDTEDAEDLEEDLEVLTQLFLRNKNKLSQIPVTIVITKSDLLSSTEKEYAYKIVENIYSPLFQPGNNMKVLIVPVCIGENLGRGVQGANVTGTVFGDPQQGNIHIPIVFNMYHFLNSAISEEKQILASLTSSSLKEEEALRIAEGHNGLERWWKGEDKEEMRQNIKNYEELKREKLKKIKQLEHDLSLTTSLFSKDCKYYINGSLVKL